MNRLSTLRISAQHGCIKSQFILGTFYRKGLLVESCQARAFYWFRQAAEQNYTPAIVCVGEMYQFGLGVKKDVGYALIWFEKSARQGCASSVEKLKHCLILLGLDESEESSVI